METGKNTDLIVSEVWQKGVEYIQQGSENIKTVILQSLENNIGAVIGRNGTIELTSFLLYNHEKNIDKDRLKVLELNAGIFFNKSSEFLDWYNEYKIALDSADVLACGWYGPLARPEIHYIDKENPGVYKIPLRSLEPYYLENLSWTSALENQNVAVVSSFTNSMKEQLDFMDRIWKKRPNLIPKNVNWSFIRSYYSPALAQGKCQWPSHVKSWKDAVDHLEERVLKTGAKICLIGCGGLGMPLAARLKSNGIVAIVMGGAIQILFGIKGRRWENHPIISRFFNDDWIVPTESEIPNGALKVEGGCYW
jgi:hypothetical protein